MTEQHIGANAGAFAASTAISQPTVLVLAAGRGERFLASGGTCHKLQAEIAEGVTVLQAVLAAVQASGLPFHVEHGPHAGMGDSIAAAVRATRQAPGWLILPADLPLILPASLRRVAQALAIGADELDEFAVQEAIPRPRVVQPAFRGQTGHPVGFSKAAFAQLCDLQGDQGASAIVKQARAQGGLQLLELDDGGVVTDVDTLPLLEQARQKWQARLR